jgi:hypothetical protein
MDKALAQFGASELEAPSHEARELAEVRHYEVMTRIDTLCQAAKAGVQAVVDVHRKVQDQGDLPRGAMNHLHRLECDTYETARSIIRNLGYR